MEKEKALNLKILNYLGLFFKYCDLWLVFFIAFDCGESLISGFADLIQRSFCSSILSELTVSVLQYSSSYNFLAGSRIGDC